MFDMETQGPPCHKSFEIPRQLDFLSPAEVSQTLTLIHNLKSHWREYQMASPAGPFFYTLGIPSYEYGFGRRSVSEYLDLSKKIFPILREEFQFLNEKIICFFSDLFKEHVELNSEGFSPPGFHIFESHADLLMQPEGFHVDNQSFWLPWTTSIDRSQSISFTISLEEPSGGSFLQWKNFRYRFREILKTEEGKRHFDQMPLFELAYKKGSLVLHDGFSYHKIGPWKKISPHDRRITHQGHLVKSEKGWMLFW